MEAEREQRREADPWEETLTDALVGLSQVTIPDALRKVGAESSKHDQLNSKRMVNVLRAMRWAPSPRRPGGKRLWHAPETHDAVPRPNEIDGDLIHDS
jgi:hypothetical protein